jgi:hypothetical protein
VMSALITRPADQRRICIIRDYSPAIR